MALCIRWTCFNTVFNFVFLQTHGFNHSCLEPSVHLLISTKVIQMCPIYFHPRKYTVKVDTWRERPKSAILKSRWAHSFESMGHTRPIWWIAIYPAWAIIRLVRFACESQPLAVHSVAVPRLCASSQCGRLPGTHNLAGHLEACAIDGTWGGRSSCVREQDTLRPPRSRWQRKEWTWPRSTFLLN